MHVSSHIHVYVVAFTIFILFPSTVVGVLYIITVM